jgi:hypothetical protein
VYIFDGVLRSEYVAKFEEKKALWGAKGVGAPDKREVTSLHLNFKGI